MFGSVGEKTTNNESLNDEVAAPVAVSQNWTLPSWWLFGSVVDPAIAVPSDEKERKWWYFPMNQLVFVSTKTYLKEFIMFEEVEDNVV